MDRPSVGVEHRLDIFDIADDPDGENDALAGEFAPLPSSFDAGDDTLAAMLQCGDGGTGVRSMGTELEKLALNISRSGTRLIRMA